MVVNVKVAREACARPPLAEASLRLVDLVTHDDSLADVFERYRGRSYEKVIPFGTFVRLIADALPRNHDGARQSFRRAQEEETLRASLAAAYGKLARYPSASARGSSSRPPPGREPSSPRPPARSCPTAWPA